MQVKTWLSSSFCLCLNHLQKLWLGKSHSGAPLAGSHIAHEEVQFSLFLLFHEFLSFIPFLYIRAGTFPLLHHQLDDLVVSRGPNPKASSPDGEFFSSPSSLFPFPSPSPIPKRGKQTSRGMRGADGSVTYFLKASPLWWVPLLLLFLFFLLLPPFQREGSRHQKEWEGLMDQSLTY